MPDERAADARVEHHRNAAGRNLARLEPSHRTLAGAASDLLRSVEIAGMQARGEIRVPRAAPRRRGPGPPREAGARRRPRGGTVNPHTSRGTPARPQAGSRLRFLLG